MAFLLVVPGRFPAVEVDRALRREARASVGRADLAIDRAPPRGLFTPPASPRDPTVA